MSINLVYPIKMTHEHLAMRQDKSVMAFYRIPNTPITITDTDKKEKHKITVAQMIKKLSKNKTFEISLIPKDYLLEEKMVDFAEALTDDSRQLGEELLLYSVDKLTQEMEIPYQFDWLIGVTLRKQQKLTTIKEMANDSFLVLSEKLANGLGYESEISDTWYEDYTNDEFTVYQALSSLRAQRLSDEELFYYLSLIHI